MKFSRTFWVIIFLAFVAFSFIAVKYKAGFRRIYYLNNPRELLPNVQETEHFHICTDLDSESIQYYVQFFEGFFDHFSKNYFTIGQKKPLNVYLFKDASSYDPFVKTFQTYTPYGFYMGPEENIIVVNCDSGLGTATHELVHHFIATSFTKRPPRWIDEGIATFFEKFIGHLDSNGNLEISFGYFSNWRFPITKSRASFLSLRGLTESEEPDQCAARSFMLFLHKKGFFCECVKEWKNATNDTARLDILKNVYGKPIGNIEKEWRDWVKQQPIDADVKLVQQAFVLTEQQWDQWWQMNGKFLYWSQQEQIYRVKNY